MNGRSVKYICGIVWWGYCILCYLIYFVVVVSALKNIDVDLLIKIY